MLKILVLNAPFFPKFSRPQRSPAVTKSGTLYYPMWLAFAVGVLEAEGHEVTFVDAPARGLGLKDVVTMVTQIQPRLVVIDTSTPSIHADIKAAEHAKKAAPATTVMLVGPHATALPEETMALSEAVDVIAVGEYDYTVRDVASALDKDADLASAPGIFYRADGSIRQSSKRGLVEDLDRLPFVTSVFRKHLDPFDYFNPNARFPNVTMITGRGCPHQCSFCVYPQTMTGNRHRVRSIDNLITEIQYVIEAFPEMKEIFFEDDTLTGSKKRCREICDRIIRENIRFGWVGNSRADLDYETMCVMKQAGCRELCVGFESGNQVLLNEMDKKMTIEQEHAFMRDARRAGILIHGCFMVGFPGETNETMDKTMSLARRLAPDSAQFYPMMVYPGTRAYDEFKANGMLTTEDFNRWLTPTGLHNCVTRTDDLSPEDLVRFCDRARRCFYLSARYMIYKLRQLFLHPSELGRTLKAAKTFVKYLIRGSY
ncbi:B12-binding domain-containing radical SAM protein [Verrucomicrobiota bacterium]